MKYVSLLLVCTVLTGCMTKVGSRKLPDDSIRYNHAVHNSVDSQLLLNIVRLRYRDNPTFLQVGVISSGYEVKNSISAEAKLENIGINDDRNPLKGFIAPKIGLDYTEKPTTTLSPVRGQAYVTEMLSPLSLETVLILHSSGWRIDRILRCCVQRLNHLKNAPGSSGPTPKYAPEFENFFELANLLEELERDDLIQFEKRKDPHSGALGYYLTLDEDADPYLLNRFWSLLDLDHGLMNIKIIPYHAKRKSRQEIIVDTRSPLSVMYYLSHGVHIPKSDEYMGKITQTRDKEGYLFNWDEVLNGMMTIHSGPLCGAHPSVIVCYRGTVFYIDDSDLESKSTFSLLSQILALQTGPPEIPYLTLPLN